MDLLSVDPWIRPLVISSVSKGKIGMDTFCNWHNVLTLDSRAGNIIAFVLKCYIEIKKITISFPPLHTSQISLSIIIMHFVGSGRDECLKDPKDGNPIISSIN